MWNEACDVVPLTVTEHMHFDISIDVTKACDGAYVLMVALPDKVRRRVFACKPTQADILRFVKKLLER